MGSFISTDFVRLGIASPPAGNKRLNQLPAVGSGSFDRNAALSTPDVDKICEGKGPGNAEFWLWVPAQRLLQFWSSWSDLTYLTEAW